MAPHDTSDSTTSSASLPFDIFGVIVDILASGTNSNPYLWLKDLISLSFSCHNLLLLCQPYIFRTVNLRGNFRRPKDSNPTGKPRYEIPTIGVQEMATVVKRNPRVTRYVRNLNLQLSPSDTIEDGLVDILRQLTCLEKLAVTPPENVHYIHGIQHWWADGDEDLDGEGDLGLLGIDSLRYIERYDQSQVNWHQIPHKVQDVLRKLIHLPKLTTLKLLRVTSFPTDILALAANLHTLHVNRCEFVAVSPSGLVPNFSGIQLRQFKIHPGSPLNIQMLKGLALPNVRPVLDLSRTRNLFFTFKEIPDEDESELEQLADLLDGLSHLETLTIFYRYWWPSFNSTGSMNRQNFRWLTNLRNLRILWDTPGFMYYDGTIKATLQGMTSCKMLENIDIRIKLYPGYIAPVVEDLQGLDDHLSNFPALNSVSIAIFLDHNPYSDLESRAITVLQSFNLPSRSFYQASSIRLLLNLPKTHLPFLSSSSTVNLAYSVMDAVGARVPTTIVNTVSGIRNEAYTNLTGHGESASRDYSNW